MPTASQLSTKTAAHRNKLIILPRSAISHTHLWLISEPSSTLHGKQTYSSRQPQQLTARPPLSGNPARPAACSHSCRNTSEAVLGSVAGRGDTWLNCWPCDESIPTHTSFVWSSFGLCILRLRSTFRPLVQNSIQSVYSYSKLLILSHSIFGSRFELGNSLPVAQLSL